MTRERETPPPAKGGAPEMSLDGDKLQRSSPNRQLDVDPRWGDVFTFVMACAGSPTCAWRPYECRLIGGA